MQVSMAILGLSLLLQAEAPTAPPSPPDASTATPAPAAAPAPAPAAFTDTTSAQPAPRPAAVKLAAGTQLQVELVDPLSSATAQLSARFKIRLAEPIFSEGVEIVPAGALGEGEIIDAAKAGMNGREGKLIIAARHLDLNGSRVRVRGMSIMGSGTSRVDLATGLSLVPYVGLITPFIQGGETVMPSGTRATVRLAQDVELTVPPPGEQAATLNETPADPPVEKAQ